MAAEPATSSVGGSLRMWVTGEWLTDDDWRFRHRVVLWVLWGHAPFLFLLGAYGGTDQWFTKARFTGYGVGHTLLEVLIVPAAAVLASLPFLHRRLSAAIAGAGLVACSALLTHFSGGFIEAHFHFFVMVGLAAMYVDWVPFGLTILFVVIHHGVAGSIDPEGVFNHPTAIAHPWRWAGIHAAFIAAMAATQVGNMILVGKKMESLARQRARDERKQRAKGLV